MGMVLQGLGALVLLLLALLSPADATTYYTSPGGSNGNNCTSEGSACASINGALGKMRGGDLLLVKAGTYAECIDDNIPAGSANAPTIIRSQPPRTAILRPTGCKASDGVAIILIGRGSGRQYITIEGLVIDGSGSSAPVAGIGMRSPSGDDNSWTTNISIINNEIKNMPNVDNPNNSNGIGIGSGTDKLLIQGNYIHDIGMNAASNAQFLSYCLYWSGRNSVVENNELGPCSGYGIHGYHNQSLGPGGGGGNIIRNNWIHDNGTIGLLMCPGNNQIYQNRIARNGWHQRDPGGLQLGGYCSGVNGDNNQVNNNTLVGNKPYCIRLGVNGAAGANNNKIRNNICWQNGSDVIQVENGSNNTIDRNMLNVNPQFVNAGNSDYRLNQGSAAIDAGLDVGLPYKGSKPDIGACETQTTACGGTATGEPQPPALPAPTNLRLVTTP
jgi:hypothetical protein